MKKIILYTTITGLIVPHVVLAAITNPMKFKTINEFMAELLEVIIFISVPIIVVMVIYGGFLFVTAGGNVEKINSAKKTLLWTLIGAVIILGATVIKEVIVGTVDSLK